MVIAEPWPNEYNLKGNDLPHQEGTFCISAEWAQAPPSAGACNVSRRDTSHSFVGGLRSAVEGKSIHYYNSV